MIKNPFFSIIIVNYNYDKYLEQCIKSVINQKERDYEIIVIDGGSNDSSINILKRYNKYFKYYISEKDNGQSHALNKGLSEAIGDYVFWLNSDDFLINNSLFYLKKYIINNLNIDWFTGNTIFVNENNNIIKFYNGLDFNKSFLINPYINVGGPTSIVKKSIYDKVGFFNENLNFTMDSDMWIRIYNSNVKFKNIGFYIWGFRLHKNSKTSSSHSKIFISEHLNEISFLKMNYGIKFSYINLFYEKLLKFFSIHYLIAFYNSFKYKGLNIKDFESNSIYK